jgi:hypothetical protein
MTQKRQHSFKVGDTVELNTTSPGPKCGTVTQISRCKIRVLFPIRKFVWLFPTDVTKTGEARILEGKNARERSGGL